MVFHDLPCPFAELHRAGIVDLKPNSNNLLEIIVIQIAGDCAFYFILNRQVFLDSFLWP